MYPIWFPRDRVLVIGRFSIALSFGHARDAPAFGLAITFNRKARAVLLLVGFLQLAWVVKGWG